MPRVTPIRSCPACRPACLHMRMPTACCRHLKGGNRQRLWQPELEPPPVLRDLVVVAVGTKKPPVWPHQSAATPQLDTC